MLVRPSAIARMAFRRCGTLARIAGRSWGLRGSVTRPVLETVLVDVAKKFSPAELGRWSMTNDTPIGSMHHLGPVLRLSETPPRWVRPSAARGS